MRHRMPKVVVIGVVLFAASLVGFAVGGARQEVVAGVNWSALLILSTVFLTLALASVSIAASVRGTMELLRRKRYPIAAIQAAIGLVVLVAVAAAVLFLVRL